MLPEPSEILKQIKRNITNSDIRPFVSKLNILYSEILGRQLPITNCYKSDLIVSFVLSMEKLDDLGVTIDSDLLNFYNSLFQTKEVPKEKSKEHKRKPIKKKEVEKYGMVYRGFSRPVAVGFAIKEIGLENIRKEFDIRKVAEKAVELYTQRGGDGDMKQMLVIASQIRTVLGAMGYITIGTQLGF